MVRRVRRANNVALESAIQQLPLPRIFYKMKERKTCRFGQQAAHEARQSAERDGTWCFRGGSGARVIRHESGGGAAQQAIDARAHRAAFLVEARGQSIGGTQPVRTKTIHIHCEQSTACERRGHT